MEGTSKPNNIKDAKKGNDPFVSGVATAWSGIEKYRVAALSFAAAFVLLGAGYSVYAWKSKQSEVEAQGQYFLAKRTLDDIQKSFSVDEKAVLEAEKNNTKPPLPKQKTNDITQDYGPAVEKLESVVNQFPKSKAAVMAGLELSTLFQEYKQADRALSVMEKLEKSAAKGDITYGFVLLHKGNALQAKGDCGGAISVWERINQEKSLNLVHAESLLRQALCRDSMGETAKAQEIFRKLVQDFADTDPGKAARRFLRAVPQAG